MKILSASGQVGYGFDLEAFNEALERQVDYIGCDAGSMDPGPFYLGQGEAFVSKEAYKRDLEIMLKAGLKRKVPVVVGSSGGAGGEPHLRWSLSILLDIAKSNNMNFKLAIIHSEQNKEYLIKKIRKGQIKPLGPVKEISEDDIIKSHRIVGMMGAEPIIEALNNNADVILAGRCSDSAIFAAPGIIEKYPKGQVWHLGKIIECGASVALPKIGNDCMLGELYQKKPYFTVCTTNKNKTCPRIRVAAHTLYENPDPYYLYEPSGMLDTSRCSYEQVNPSTVKVQNSKFIPSKKYTVKLEGVEFVGYRTISIGGIRDPILINRIDSYIDDLKGNLRKRIENIGFNNKDYKIYFRIYGKNGVMGEKEPVNNTQSHELGIIIDVVAETQETAHTILSLARHLCLHSDYENRFCISGNVAFPYSPSDIDTGPVYRFNIWHLLELDDPLECFNIEYKGI